MYPDGEVGKEELREIVEISLDLLRVDEALREKRIHDYFCENIVYDEQGTKQETAFGRLVAAHSIIGVFARKRGVCEGIAKATKLLFNAVDMGCIVVPGKKGTTV